MKSKLKIIGLILIGIGVGYLGTDLLLTLIKTPTEIIPDEPEQVVEVETVKEFPGDPGRLPIIMQIVSGHNVTDGERIKQYINGNTEITYSVKVENGVEATPGPSVLQAMRDSMSEEQKRLSDEYHASLLYERMGEHKDWYLKSKIHRSSDIVKKEYLDSVFTCENYQLLAWQWKADQLGGGTAEDYIYTKAFNECINPKHQQEVDKAHHELEEAYAESIEEVDTND